ncbi:hypothetical protein AAF712_002275 [Marasmius tenuissimus]|uniref:Integral membrane protein n=1 Tax=Marasmius tenuissimus TaxID=585030 RepID=A0ABR3AAT4_9AGAR|nr:hypothetical protein PM082_020352 [Marasmius tenuissimus]
MALQFTKAALIGSFLECMAYGIYFVVFLQALQILHKKLVLTAVNHAYLLATALILWVLATVRVMLNVTVTVSALTTKETIVPNAAAISTALWISHTIVADIFIVYRVYAFWSHRPLVLVVPFLLAIADAVSGVLLMTQTPKMKTYSTPTRGSIVPHAMAFYSFTFALNILCTGLIASRIFVSELQNGKSSSLKLRKIAEIVIESAAIYSACLIPLLVCVLGSAETYNIQWLFIRPLPSIVGLTFSLIIIRIGSGACERASTACESDASRSIGFARPQQTTRADDIHLDVMTLHSKIDPSDVEAQSQNGSDTKRDT